MDSKITVSNEELAESPTALGGLLAALARQRGLWGQHLATYPDESVKDIRHRATELIGLASVNADELLKVGLELDNAEHLSTIIYAAQQLTDMARGLTEITHAMDDIEVARHRLT